MQPCSIPDLECFRSEGLAPLHSCHRLSWVYGRCDSAVASVTKQAGASPSTSVLGGTQSDGQGSMPHPHTHTPHSTMHHPVSLISKIRGDRQGIRTGIGSFLQTEGLRTMGCFGILEACEVPQHFTKSLRRKLQKKIHAQHTPEVHITFTRGSLQGVYLFLVSTEHEVFVTLPRYIGKLRPSWGAWVTMHPFLCT